MSRTIRNPEFDDDFCPNSKDGKHELDPHSVQTADVDASEGCIVDVSCKHCGRSGAHLIRLEDVDW